MRTSPTYTITVISRGFRPSLFRKSLSKYQHRIDISLADKHNIAHDDISLSGNKSNLLTSRFVMVTSLPSFHRPRTSGVSIVVSNTRLCVQPSPWWTSGGDISKAVPSDSVT